MRAGRHAFRLVTLAGDVMHSGGSMTGGSTQSRAVNLLGRERELKELTERLRKGKTELERPARPCRHQQRKTARPACARAAQEMHQQEIAVARETEHAAAAALEGPPARSAWRRPTRPSRPASPPSTRSKAS